VLDWLQATLAQEDYAEFLLRLFIDLIAVTLLAVGIFQRRHQRRDMVVAFLCFNIGLFAVMSVISTRHIGVGLGFGLFAILSIIRLRSEPFDNVELGYFFGALVLALVNGIAKTDVAFSLVLTILVISVAYLADHPSLHTTIRRRRVTLDTIETDVVAVRARLEAEYRIEIVDLAITQIDHVRDTTRVVLRYVDPLHGSTMLDRPELIGSDDD
jgi:uncharacterized membrane protein YiaA